MIREVMLFGNQEDMTLTFARTRREVSVIYPKTNIQFIFCTRILKIFSCKLPEPMSKPLLVMMLWWRYQCIKLQN